MLVLGISGGIIFLLPYLKEIYYRPLADALGLSNTQVGLMMSAFGVTALISYFPGGWLADRYSPRGSTSLSMGRPTAGSLFAITGRLPRSSVLKERLATAPLPSALITHSWPPGRETGGSTPLGSPPVSS